MKQSYIHAVIIQCALIICFLYISATIAFSQHYVSTYAGDGISGLVNGDTATCRFKSPNGICADQSGNLYIADGDNHCIRRITPDGMVTTYAGTGVAGYADGPDSTAQFRTPFDVCVDEAGNVYVSDFENQYIRKISADGMVSTVAGNGIAGYVDGAASVAEFNYPRGIVIDAAGNLYVSDSWNHRVRKIDASGEVSTYAGGGNIFGVQSVSEFKDGADTSARFYTPCGLSIDEAGNVYVADAYNHRVRMIDPSRVVTTVAGSGASGSAAGGYADGDATVARFNTLTELFATPSGEIYVSDTYNNRMRLIKNGVVNTVAGNGTAGFLDGVDTVAKFNHPRGVLADASGKYLFVCDGINRRIRKVTFDITVGIETMNDEKKFSVFPNPSCGIFYVTGNILGQEIRVKDLFGKEVFAGIFKKDDLMELNLEAAPAGMYLLTIFSGSVVAKTYKVLKTL